QRVRGRAALRSGAAPRPRRLPARRRAVREPRRAPLLRPGGPAMTEPVQRSRRAEDRARSGTAVDLLSVLEQHVAPLHRKVRRAVLERLARELAGREPEADLGG